MAQCDRPHIISCYWSTVTKTVSLLQ